METRVHTSQSQYDAGGSNSECNATWPLTFSLQIPQQQTISQSLQHLGSSGKRSASKLWWSHKLYRKPGNIQVQILYSKTPHDSELIARQFLKEDAVGFDMEWPWNDWKRSDLQNKIGLIQIAAEDKIALFHIGLHVGKTTDEIIAPSLRHLIEDPKIAKLGVGILNADFARLHRFFHLKPKGALELSHLYRLVKYGDKKPELVSTKLVSLARLVEDQLGYPLYKGDVRTSNWSRPLSRDQIDYAASDAYAGFMLYHCMNFKRSQMDPVPPMPIHAEQYLAYKLSGVVPLRLTAHSDDGSIMTSEDFFKVPMDQGAYPVKRKSKENHPSTSRSASGRPKLPKELTDARSQLLYSELLARREALAKEKGLQDYRITTHAVLVALALERPTTQDQLLAVKGIGKKQQETYGNAWLEVILKSMASNHRPGVVPSTTLDQGASPATYQQIVKEVPSISDHTQGRMRSSSSADSSSALGTPPKQAPMLHTGLSFTLHETRLGLDMRDENAAMESDDSLPSLDFGIMKSHETPPYKRKRTESPSVEKPQPEISSLQHPIENHHSSRCLPMCEKGVDQDFIEEQSIDLAPVDSSTLRLRIARNKLQAFSKRVTGKLSDRPTNAPPIVSDRTLSLIVVRAPQTQEEVERIPGIDALLLACQQTNTDLLRNILKLVPPQTVKT